MSESLVAKRSVTVHADAAKVWDALTNPEMIKQYLYGTRAFSDWTEGSSITYEGVWQGKSYKDIKKIELRRILVTTYWSALSGLPDLPENYSTVTYALSERDGETTLTVTTDNIDTKESVDHTEANWNSVLEKLKELLEK
jgi:uncharacterized protein YndB with AHSA1/START domain